MKFSPCGRLLATAGQDRVLRIWVLKTAFTYFQDMRSRCNADNKSSPTPSQESLVSQHSSDDPVTQQAQQAAPIEKESDPRSPFVEKPFCTYLGHTSDLLDVSWSKVIGLNHCKIEFIPCCNLIRVLFFFRIISSCLRLWTRQSAYGTYRAKSASAVSSTLISSQPSPSTHE